MTFQGFLTDDTGVPYGNAAPVNQDIAFKIYAAPTGDAPHLWGESQVVTIDKGHFSVLLGLGSAVGAKPPLYDVFTGVDASSRWMELTVGTKVISPRIQFFAAPYAQLARVANELASDTGDITSTGTIQTTGDIDAKNVKASGKITGASMDLGTGTINSGSIESSGLIRSEGGLSSGTGVVTPYLEVNGNLVQENGNFTSSGNITGKAITGTSLSLGNGTIASGDISGKRLIGTSLETASIDSGDIFATGQINAKGPQAAFYLEARNKTWDGRWQFVANDIGAAPAYRWSVLELKKFGGTSDYNVVSIPALLQAQSYSNISDERFKKVYGISKGAEDLSTLKNIKIKNYEWITNKKLEKKIIAQQVKDVYPQAVSISPGYSLIPNISSKATNVHHDNSRSELHIEMDKPHALAVGDSIGMRVGKGFLKEKKVIQITDKSTFVVSSAESYDDIFVVGKHVNDVLTVDYDAIAMLNVSATQELARQAEELESRVRDLEARERRVALLEKDLEAKQSRMEAFEKRLDALDKRLVSVSPQIDRNTEGLQVSVSTGSSR
jgi:hypothetical protein